MLRTNAHEAKGTWALPLLKVRPKQAATVVIQSAVPIWADVHWFDRQIPCAGAECPACSVQPARVRGYFVALAQVGPDRRPCLVECSPGSMSALAGLQQMASEGWEPGVMLECSRRRVNSPLRLEPCEDRGPVIEQLVGEDRVRKALAVLWQLPMPIDGETAETWENRSRKAVLNRLEKAIG